MIMRIERRAFPEWTNGQIESSERPLESPLTPPLPSPGAASWVGADPAILMATLMVEAGQQSRRAAETLRRSQEAIIERQEREQIASMEKKAADTRMRGWVEGLSTAAQGGLQMGSAELLCEAASSAPAKARKLEAASGRWLAAAKMGEGVGKVGATELAVVAERDETDATRHGQAADRAKRAAQDAGGAEREAADWIQATLRFCREYASARAQAEQAALRRA
jgi:hypothetical protein